MSASIINLSYNNLIEDGIKIGMNNPRILITSKYLQRPFEQVEIAKYFQSIGADVEFQQCATEEELILALADKDALMCNPAPVTARVIESAPRLKVIARTGIGYDTIDLHAANKKKIAVCNTPGANRIAVTEYTFALLLACARNLTQNLNEVQQGGWKITMGSELSGKTLGIVGLGMIGKSVALLARAFEMNVLATARSPDKEFAAAHQITYVQPEHLLKESDFVTLHLYLDAKTRHFINEERLALMKPTAYLINTARGAIIDNAALYQAIKNKQIQGAALDVHEQEPLGESPLRGLPSVLLSPHAASGTNEYRQRSARIAAEAIISVLHGKQPTNLINPEIFRNS